jgi:hypothetical protein
MTIKAFTDENDGYYEVDVPNGDPDPAWTAGMTPATVESQEPAALLIAAKTARIAVMQVAYDAALNTDIEFTTAAAITADFQVTDQSIGNMKATIAGFGDTGVAPADFYWVAKDNSHPVFTFADIQGLARAVSERAWVDFKNLQTKKQAVKDAADVTAVNAINW